MIDWFLDFTPQPNEECTDLQILYQVNAAGVDVRRVIDTQLQKLAGEAEAASGAEGLKGGR